MFVRLFISLFIVLVVYFASSRIEKRCTMKERCQTIFSPAWIVRILSPSFVLLLMGERETILLKGISFLFSFAITSFIVFSLLSVSAESLRKRYEAKQSMLCGCCRIFYTSISIGHLRFLSFVLSLCSASAMKRCSVIS